MSRFHALTFPLTPNETDVLRRVFRSTIRVSNFTADGILYVTVEGSDYLDFLNLLNDVAARIVPTGLPPNNDNIEISY